jgi:hypothetical protein
MNSGKSCQYRYISAFGLERRFEIRSGSPTIPPGSSGGATVKVGQFSPDCHFSLASATAPCEDFLNLCSIFIDL